MRRSKLSKVELPVTDEIGAWDSGNSMHGEALRRHANGAYPLTLFVLFGRQVKREQFAFDYFLE